MLGSLSRSFRRSPNAPTSPTSPSFDPNSNPLDLFGQVSIPTSGILLLPGRSRESAGMARVVLQENHTRFHIFFNDDGFHNHTAHHILASYSMGGKAELIKDIYDLHEPRMKLMLPLQPVEVTEQNWKEFLGDEIFYPNYLAFFTTQISTLGATVVVEKYLSDSTSQMLTRAVSGAINPLIHIGYGVEFGLDAIIAEGLAQTAVHDPRVATLFPSIWPPPPTHRLFSNLSKLSSFTSSFTPNLGGNIDFSALSLNQHPSGHKNVPTEKQIEEVEREMTEIGSNGSVQRQDHQQVDQAPQFPFKSRSSSGSISRPNHTKGRDSISFKPPTTASSIPQVSFVHTSQRLSRNGHGARLPRYGLSAFTILSHIQNDPQLGPGNAVKMDDFPKLDVTLENRGREIREYCENWIIDVERGWEEIVERCEELFWVTTVMMAGSSRPGKKCKLDFFLMHALTSVLFLPSLLENVSAHLRPHILTSHFRVLIAYWVSRGRPKLWVKETIMTATSTPLPPIIEALGEKTAVRRKIEEEEEEELREQREREKEEKEKEKEEKELETEKGEKNETDDKEDVKGEQEIEKKDEKVSVDIAESEKLKEKKRGHASERAVMQTNVWGAILASAVDHPDEHLTKAIRTLAFADSLWGSTPAGVYKCSLDGTEIMDGSIFVRTAGLCLETLGWVREGMEEGDWDRSVLGFDEAWEDE